MTYAAAGTLGHLAVRIYDSVLSQSLIGFSETSKGCHYIDMVIVEASRIHTKQCSNDALIASAMQWIMPYDGFTLTGQDKIAAGICR